MRAGHPRVTVTRPLQRPCSRDALCHTPAPPPHWSVVPHIVHRCCQAGLRQTTSHQSVRSVASVTLASFSVHCTLYTVHCTAAPAGSSCTPYTRRMYRFWLEENYAKASPIKLNNHHDLEWMDLKDSGYLDMCKIGVPPIIKHCYSLHKILLWFCSVCTDSFSTVPQKSCFRYKYYRII